jgi:hypothetical protein
MVCVIGVLEEEGCIAPLGVSFGPGYNAQPAGSIQRRSTFLSKLGGDLRRAVPCH